MDQVTARVIAKLRTSAEGKEGMQAFLDKRTPGWNDT
jgi:1,4-dihydroxy-2-naphthoyl-CoA synthase